MDYDVVIIGGGAAGLMCARYAGQAGLRTLVLERANKVGKKILMSGGGRCNFTNLHVTHEHYLSANPHFCRSALARYSPFDFIELVERHGIAYHEKEVGQLFCDDSSKQIVAMLLEECRQGRVEIRTGIDTQALDAVADGFVLRTGLGSLRTPALVVASGGLSVPTLGGSGWGYQVARQFGHELVPTRAGLVPFTLTGAQSALNEGLAGVSARASVRSGAHVFTGPVLMTHRGISGPAVLQLSSYWQPGETVEIDWLVDLDDEWLRRHKRERPQDTPAQALARHLPVRLAERLATLAQAGGDLQGFSDARLQALTQRLRRWPVAPSGTEGYRTAEVTLGGVDTRGVSSRSFESLRQPGLYFIGEVLDVTGHLGGFNFQWAWASAVACAQALQERAAGN